MGQFIKRLIILAIGFSILIGIPYFFGEWWLLISWLPAIICMTYLHEDK